MSDEVLGCRANVPQHLAQPRGIPCTGGGHWVSWGREWKDSKIARKVCVMADRSWLNCVMLQVEEKKARLRVASGGEKKKKGK